MPLRFGDVGFATAYASLPIGTFEDEVRKIRGKIRLWRRIQSHDPHRISDPDFIYLLGQADLAAQIRLSDFRDVFDIRYPTSECNATTVNWVFSVGFDLPELDLRDRPGDDFQFLLHLRYRRGIFAYAGAEEDVIRRVIELGREHQLIASVQAAMGWSDLIIEGTFTDSLHEQLTRFIISVHGLHLVIADEKEAVFDRTLTIIGYPGDDPPPYGHGHVMFVRAIPGKYDEIAKQLEPLGARYIVDGKADFIGGALQTRRDFLTIQRRLTSSEGAGIFEKVDTHLMYARAEDYENVAKPAALCAAVERNRLHKQCTCRPKARSKYRKLRRLLFRARHASLPQEHFYSIENMLFLLAVALKERSGCCDVREAVLACYDALETILWGLIEKWVESRSDVEAAAASVAEMSRATRQREEDVTVFYRRLDEWHRFAEVLLRQRTIGSYEEILGHTDRAVVYSGGVQKFLYLADRLINDFARRVSADLPRFGTMYDSVKTIVSRSGVGLVHIPTRNIFQLPLAVADLWHEVGTVLFAEEGLNELQPPQERDLIANLSDSFGDIVVYLFGFAGDFDKFIASFAWATTEAYGDGESSTVSPHGISQFLTRTYLVFEFHKLRALLRTGGGQELMTDDEQTVRQTVATWVGELRTYWNERFAGSRRYGPKMKITNGQWLDLYRNVIHPAFALYFRKLYVPFAHREVDSVRPSISAFEEDGTIRPIPFNADLNAYFGETAYMIQSPDAVPQNRFLLMATLAKSVTNEYHRRQATMS